MGIFNKIILRISQVRPFHMYINDVLTWISGCTVFVKLSVLKQILG